MVDLPTVPDRLITSEAPTSAVTRGDIQSNANMLAGAVDKTADALMDVSVEAAKKQAGDDLLQQKVTRNADGSVGVANPANSLIFGRAGEVYEQAVKAGTVAQHGNVISQTLNDLHLKYQTEPDAFRAAATSFRNSYIGQQGGAAGEAVARDFDQQATQHYNAIADSTAHADLARQGSAISANQTSARDDALAMVRGGIQHDDPALQTKLAQWDTASQQRTANPLFGYSPEQAHLDRETFHSEVTASALLYDVNKTYQSQVAGGGYAGAMVKAQDILTNPGYKLSQPLREQYYHRAVADIRANEALRHQSLSEARSAFTELSVVSAGGGRIESDQVEQLAAAFRAAGDPGRAARVYSYFARKPLNDDFGKQPLAQQTQQLSALHGANAAASAQQFFVGKGYTPEQAAGIVGNLVHESGMDANASGDNGTSGGLAQFHNERLTALRSYAASVGKPATDFQTQLEFIDRELHTTEAGTLAKLQASKTPEDAAAAFINYERPQGWTPDNPAGGLGYQSRINQARAIFDRRPTDQTMGPAGSMWLEANRQHEIESAATTQWTAVMKDYGAARTRPSLQTVNSIVQAAHLANNTALLDQISHDSQRMDLAREASQMPLAAQQGALDAASAAGSSGALPIGVAAAQKELQDRHDAIVKGLDANPIATTITNFSDKLKPVGPIDFSTDGGLAGSLAARAAVAQFAQNNWKVPSVRVLDEQDISQVQAALQSPQGGRVLTTMAAALKPDEMLKLLAVKEFKNSVTGMLASADPGQMSAAMSVADKLWRADPAQAETLLGSKAIDRLHTWQGLKDTFTPPEIAANVNAARDPTIVKVREDARKAALEETLKQTPGDMAYKLGTSWGIPIVSRVANVVTGATPKIPFDATAAGVMVYDYRNAYAALRAYGVDADKASDLAVQRMRSTWGVSAAAGNQVMKNAPEQYYPAIGGSKDWIGDDLKTWVGKQAGAEFADTPRSLEAGIGTAGQERNWSIEGMVSDGQTQAEIKAGRPPSYQVAIRRKDGTLDILPSRIAFDPARHLSTYTADLQRRFHDIQTNRWAHAGDKPSYSFGEALPQ